MVSRLIARVLGADKILLLALALSFLGGIQGLDWGHYACLNPDAMAFRSISNNPPLHPGRFDKPPLHTYINNTLINEPSKVVAAAFVFLGADKHNAESARWHWRMIASRLLQSAFYAGAIIFVFLFARDWFGVGAARVSAILLGTCAGMIPYKIFLTADMPLIFWMTACLYFSGRILRHPDSLGASLLAGACAGLATATKYNGLGIAVALPLAHLLAPGGIAAAWKRKSLYFCGLAVPLAFILANPYCILDHRKFIADFMYNYTVTPVYSGEIGVGYRAFLGRFAEIFGLPLALLLPVVIAVGIPGIFQRSRSGERHAMFILAGVFVLYFWKIGGFARIETRFVLPMAPVALLLAGPGWQLLARSRPVLLALVLPLAVYGVASGWFVGEIFRCDSRMDAIEWARANMPAEARIDAAGSPAWKLLEDKSVSVTPIPLGVRRNRIFSERFSENDWVKDRLSENREKDSAEFFSAESLRARNPDYITFDSMFLWDLDPETRPFVDALLRGELGYRVVFDRETPAPPRWVYPQSPDFTRMRFCILAKE